jgi:hypothetical protein
MLLLRSVLLGRVSRGADVVVVMGALRGYASCDGDSDG